MITLGDVADAISVIQIVGDKIKHNAFALKVLAQAGYEYSKPPEDFDGIYVFALIEYGRNRPEAFTKLFAETTVKDAFQMLFEWRNRKPISEEMDRFWESPSFGSELRRLEHNPEVEISEFERIFSTQLERTRLPKEKKQYELLKSQQRALTSVEVQSTEIRRTLDAFSMQLVKSGNRPDVGQYALSPLSVTRDYPPGRPQIVVDRNDLLTTLEECLANRTWLAIVGAAGTGKTQTAGALANRLSADAVWWVSLQSRREEEASRYLSSQLVLWLVHVWGTDDVFHRYMMGSLGLDSVVLKLATGISGRGVLVVDDLPDALASSGIFSIFALVASVFEQQACRIITTGHRSLPATWASSIGDQVVETRVPPLSSDEVLEILHAAQAPAFVKNLKFAELILGQTSGNPAMVLATVQWLRRNQWRIHEVMLSSGPTSQLRLDEHRRFIELCNQEQRELLYRLTLVGTGFSRELALKIASTPPQVRFPAAVLDQLTGPWLELLSDGRLQVSPLLKEAGEGNLDPSTQVAVHHAIAADYEARRTINPYDVTFLFHHLLKAQEFGRATGIVIQFMLSATEPFQAKQISWASHLYTAGIEWPLEFDLNARIMIRAVQVRVRALAGEPVDALDQDLEHLLSQAGDNNQPAVLFAYGNAGPLVRALPAATVIRRSVRAIFLMEKFSTALGPGVIAGAGDLVWFALLERLDEDNLVTFLEELRNTAPEQRTRIFESELAAEGSSLLVDKLWMREADKPEGERDWSHTLDRMNTVYAVSDALNTAPLKAAALRSRAVVICDYLDNPAEALSVLRGQAEKFEAPQEFLLTYTKSMVEIAAGDRNAAIATIQNALTVSTHEFAALRAESRKRLIVLFEQTERLGQAKRLCIDCLGMLDRIEPSVSLERSELLGELSWIHFRSDDWPRVLTSIYSAIQCLANQDPTTARFKEVFNKIGHAIGWFSSIAAVGHPPRTTSIGDIYAPVIDGFFVSRQPRLGQYDQPMGFEISTLLIQVVVLADTLGSLGTAWHVHTQVKKSLYGSRKHPVTEAYHSFAASLEAVFGSFADAVDHGLIAARAIAATNELNKRGDALHGLPSHEVIERIWRELTGNQRVSAQHYLHYSVFGPAFARAVVETSTLVDLETQLAGCRQAVAVQADEFEDVTYWYGTIAYFQTLLVAKQLGNWSLIPDDTTIHPVMQAFARWISSGNPTAKLAANFSKQVSVAVFLKSTDRFGKYMSWYFNQFLHTYWLNIGATRRFALRHPDLFLSDLRAIRITSHASTSARILGVAASAIGVSIPADIQIDE